MVAVQLLLVFMPSKRTIREQTPYSIIQSITVLHAHFFCVLLVDKQWGIGSVYNPGNSYKITWYPCQRGPRYALASVASVASCIHIAFAFEFVAPCMHAYIGAFVIAMQPQLWLCVLYCIGMAVDVFEKHSDCIQSINVYISFMTNEPDEPNIVCVRFLWVSCAINICIILFVCCWC